MKKAQISQTFIIIFSLIIITLIVVFSTKGIGGILSSKCDADLIKFKVDIQNAIEEYKNYGVVEKHLVLAPCDYNMLCFIDSEATQADLSAQVDTGSEDLDKFLNIAITDQNQVLKNVFLFDGDIVADAGLVPILKLPEDQAYMCILKKSGRFPFITQGQGRTTKVMTVDSVES